LARCRSILGPLFFFFSLFSQDLFIDLGIILALLTVLFTLLFSSNHSLR
jgi:hypothetical protein